VSCHQAARAQRQSIGADSTALLRRTTDTTPAHDGLSPTEIRIGTRFQSVGAFLSSVVQSPYAHIEGATPNEEL